VKLPMFRAEVFLCALALGGNACGYPSQPDYPGSPMDPVSVQAVKVAPQTILLSAIGETRQLSATIAPDDATDKAVAWESSDTSVASVSATGLVTAMAAGSGVFVTVVTRDGHREASVNVTVDPFATVIPVEAVKVTPQSMVLTRIGETRQVTASIGPDNATDKAVTWESSDSSVATVDAAGLVTARGIGSGVFITVVTHDGHLQSSTNVSVDP
jgi:uncharacterized protein YjdB